MNTAPNMNDSFLSLIVSASSLDDEEIVIFAAIINKEASRRQSGPPKPKSGEYAFGLGPRSSMPPVHEGTAGQRVQDIFEKEGFRVSIFDANGAAVPPETPGFIPYAFDRKMRGDSPVQQWKALRFSRLYPGYTVKVLLGDGREAGALTHLEKVRLSTTSAAEVAEAR